MPTTIITDSTAYLPAELINELKIGIVSLNIVFSDHQSRELDLNFDDFYTRLPDISQMPTTSQPAPGEVYECFRRYLEQGHDIIGIFISSGISGTYETVYTVCSDLREQYPNAIIEIIDSKQTAAAMGYPVIQAAKWALEGIAASDIAARARGMLANMKLYFVPVTLEYLRRGGRIGNLSAAVGGMLDILPVLHLERGSIALFKAARGKKGAINRVLSCLEEDISRYGVDQVFVVHASAPDTVEEVSMLIKERFNLDVSTSEIGPVLGVHTGPGVLGVIYHVTAG